MMGDEKVEQRMHISSVDASLCIDFPIAMPVHFTIFSTIHSLFLVQQQQHLQCFVSACPTTTEKESVWACIHRNIYLVHQNHQMYHCLHLH